MFRSLQTAQVSGPASLSESGTPAAFSASLIWAVVVPVVEGQEVDEVKRMREVPIERPARKCASLDGFPNQRLSGCPQPLAPGGHPLAARPLG